MRIFGMLALAAAFVGGSPAAAQIASFSLTGSHTASFSLPLRPTDIDPAGHVAGLDDPTIFGVETNATVDGDSLPVLLHFYTAEGGGGLDLISLSATTFFRYSPAGSTVFTGTIDNPTFLAGEYDFADFESGAPFHLSLTIDAASAAPEPATWALMVLGFGAAGAALRRRKVLAPVSLA